VKAVKIHIKGLVQGIGFRPFIYRLAREHKVSGWVENRNDGVFIHAEGEDTLVDQFTISIPVNAPDASNIQSFEVSDTKTDGHRDFIIKKSENLSNTITEVSPDIAVCDRCLKDIKEQAHRTAYPFINCTNCGPRFTIIRNLPYDRPETTMEVFEMCSTCRGEYTDVLDRRFHAQPVACKNCGPQYKLTVDDRHWSDTGEILQTTAKLLEEGDIIALKGLGGFHLACDALNEETVARLRKGKNRDGKPFAVMFRDIETVKKYHHLAPDEEEELISWRRPIMILKNKKGAKKLAKSVSNHFGTTGVMLPYMPFHHLLFETTKLDVLVMTSGNIADEPVIIGNDEAAENLSVVADGLLTYNRDIYNRADDSVAFNINEKTRLIRRSRGYVPNPVNLELDTEGIFAAGAELVNCFAVGKGKQAILSQHIGDLKNLETLDFYSESFERFSRLFRFKPSLLVHDLHPDYLSTRFSRQLGGKRGGKIATIAVQHHHAHIASCMAEHKLDEEVIGVAFDGVGLGTDKTVWGAEFLVCDLADFQRVNHFSQVPMPGGDAATKNPWRMAISFLYQSYGRNLKDLPLQFLENIPPDQVTVVIKAIEKHINTPLTTSAGRLFDAVAAMTGLCTESSFHAEAPMRLEDHIDPSVTDHYPVTTEPLVDTISLFGLVADDLLAGTPTSTIAARFHNSIANSIFAVVEQIAEKTGIKKVVLSGGTFQNRYLLELAERELRRREYLVYSQQQVPSNDGGIALGQLAIAAKRRELKRI
jgi:hydrogenase maturation protein HypF